MISALMDNNEDKTLEKLKIERRKKAIQKFTILGISMVILGLITPILLIIVSIILMLAGVSSMYNIGFLTRKEEREEDLDRAFEKNFYQGVILSTAGLALFLLSLYIMSLGWRGILSI